jgi:hypothetical protein
MREGFVEYAELPPLPAPKIARNRLFLLVNRCEELLEACLVPIYLNERTSPREKDDRKVYTLDRHE